MLRNSKRIVASASVCLLFSSLACSSKPAPENFYATPQDCLNAAVAALDAGDFQKYARCLTPESQTNLAAILIQASLGIQGMRDTTGLAGATPESYAAVQQLIKETQAAMSQHKINTASLPSPASLFKKENLYDPKIREQAAAVQDKPLLISQLFAAFTNSGVQTAKHFERLDGVFGKTEIEGDVASIEVTGVKLPPGQEKGYLNFTRQDGGWLMVREY